MSFYNVYNLFARKLTQMPFLYLLIQLHLNITEIVMTEHFEIEVVNQLIENPGSG